MLSLLVDPNLLYCASVLRTRTLKYTVILRLPSVIPTENPPFSLDVALTAFMIIWLVPENDTSKAGLPFLTD